MYVVYDLHDWPKILLRNFIVTNFLFNATNIANNNDKSKWVYSVYSDYGTFDGQGERKFGNESARKVVIFGVDNSSSSHTYNRKNEL